MISARLKFVVCFCCFVKSHWKLFPFCCLFRGKVRLKKNCTKKRTFFSPRRLRIPRGIHRRRRRRRKREKTTRERSFVVVAETERLKSSDRPRCGPGIGVASWGYFSSIRVLVFSCIFPLPDKKISQKIVQRTTWPFYSSNLIYSYSHHHITIIDRQQREQHTI